ncbi:MAG: hypothetical protein Q8K78_15945 [Planctomycetaceae bacterium]|nr:hypothetical protein [Planctomycetaceae bacterium]
MKIAELEHWQRELQQLRINSRQLSDAMACAAVELREQGWEPPESLLQQMQQFGADFRRLRENMLDGRSDAAARVVSLQDLAAELSRREQVAAALERVHRAGRLRTRSGETTGPMFDRLYGAIAAAQSELISATPPVELMNALQSGKHPLAVAVRLVEDNDSLNDDDWGNAMATVTAALGRDLATALARGRMTLADEPVEAHSLH